MSTEKPSIAAPVSLDTWRITPSIDYITLEMNYARRKTLRAAMLERFTECGRQIALPKQKAVITIHDPTIEQLQFLIDFDQDAFISEIEFTIDFRPKDGTDEDDELVPVFQWLSDSVFPSPTLENPKRKYCDESDGKRFHVMPDGPSNILTTRHWEDRKQYVKQKLYHKKFDHERQVRLRSVRLEVTFGRGGCQDLELQQLRHLTRIAPDIRKVLAPFFYVARAIKPKQKRTDLYHPGSRKGLEATKFNRHEEAKVRTAWRHKGAMWAAKRGYGVYPDEEANPRIGRALDRLRNDLMQLELTENSPATGDGY